VNSAIIVAGGTGSRIGGDIPKQFMEIGSKEILSYSVETFSNHAEINEVIIVSHGKWLDHVKENHPNCKVVKGGNTRQQSVKNGLNSCLNASKSILIHDAARPLISSEIITNCIQALESADAVAPIMDSSNSLVEWDGQEAKFINRDNIKEVQTPQCFNKEVIQKALNIGIEGTDEIGLLLQVIPNSIITFVPGAEKNRKITSEDDLIIIKSLINHESTSWI